MEDGEQIVEHDDGAKEVGKIGVTFGAIEELPEAVDLDETKAAQDRVVADAQVENVERYETEAVDVEASCVHVVVAQTDRVGLEDAFFEETGAKVEQDVANVQEVGEIVEREPVEFVAAVDFVKRVAVDHDPEVVQEGERDNEAHPVGEATVRVEDEREMTLSGLILRVERAHHRFAAALAVRVLMMMMMMMSGIVLLKAFLDVLFALFFQLFGAIERVVEARSSRDVRRRCAMTTATATAFRVTCACFESRATAARQRYVRCVGRQAWLLMMIMMMLSVMRWLSC